MLLIHSRCATADRHDETLILPFELRQKSRLRATLQSGKEVGLFLERGTVLRDGDHLLGDDGRIVRVCAAVERVLLVKAATPQALARAAYHLGNRHIALQIGAGWLRLSYDHVLQEMLLGLDAEVCEEQAPFEPEAGAYSHHAAAAHSDNRAQESTSLMEEWTALRNY